MDCGTTFTLNVKARDSGSDVSYPITNTYTTPSCPSGVAPSNTAPPQLSGSPTATVNGQSGSTLNATNGSWTGSPTGYAYQWYDCDAVGNNCSSISGATSSSYAPAATDLGDTEYVAVTANNTSGNTTADSALSPAIGVPTWAPASTANIWVNTSAGSCTRNASPATYSSGAACGSFQSAYAIAHCGDTIEIEPGSYDTQDLNDVSGLDSCTSPILIEGASTGSPPVIGSVLSSEPAQTGAVGASNYILEGIDQTASSCTADGNVGCDEVFLAGGQNVVLNQIGGGSVGLFGDEHVLVEDSNFGPCFAGTPTTGDCTNNMKIDSDWTNCPDGGLACPTSNITYRNDTFQKFLANNSDTDLDHFECLFLRGGNEIMIDADHFDVCQLHAIFDQPTDGAPADTIIQNNWIDETTNSVLTSPYYDTTYNSGDANAQGIEFAGNGITGTTIRYNTLEQHTSILQTGGTVTSGSDDYIYGNIAGLNSGCIANVTYGYNIFLTGQTTCAGTDATVSSLPLVDQAYGAEDFHLTCGSTAEGFVTATSSGYTLAYDKDLAWRTAAGPREAGAESEANCGS